MKNRAFRTVAFILCVLAFSNASQAVVGSQNPTQSKAEDPSIEVVRQFINTLTDRALHIVKDNATSEEAKEQKLRTLFTDTVDTQWMAKFVLGKYWRTLPSDKQKEFTTLYHDFLLSTYLPSFKKYTGETLHLLGIKQADEDEFIAQTQINRLHQAPVRVDYRLRYINKDHMVINDIIAENVSLITTQRSEFGSVISHQDFDALIAKLKERINANHKK